MNVVCAAKENRVSPSFQTAQPGDDVNFNCKSDKNVTWKYEDGPLPSNARSKISETHGNVMEILNAKYNNTGDYICQGEDEYGDPFRAKGKLYIPGKLFIENKEVARKNAL